MTILNNFYVASLTIDKALKGKSIVVPGFINQLMRWVGALVPPVLLASLLGKRWRNTRKSRTDLLPGGYSLSELT